MRKSIAQDMAYRQSLMKYAEKYVVSQSRRPHSRPNQHTEADPGCTPPESVLGLN